MAWRFATAQWLALSRQWSKTKNSRENQFGGEGWQDSIYSEFPIDLCRIPAKLLDMAYSNDLRERVIKAVEAGGQSLNEIAKTFQIGTTTVDNWMRRRRETGTTTALPWAGGKKRALAACEATIRAAVRAQPDISLAELCAQVAQKTQVVASPSMMSRELALLQLPLKKRVSTPANATRRGSNGRAPHLRKSSTRW